METNYLHSLLIYFYKLLLILNYFSRSTTGYHFKKKYKIHFYHFLIQLEVYLEVFHDKNLKIFHLLILKISNIRLLNFYDFNY